MFLHQSKEFPPLGGRLITTCTCDCVPCTCIYVCEHFITLYYIYMYVIICTFYSTLRYVYMRRLYVNILFTFIIIIMWHIILHDTYICTYVNSCSILCNSYSFQYTLQIRHIRTDEIWIVHQSFYWSYPSYLQYA